MRDIRGTGCGVRTAESVALPTLTGRVGTGTDRYFNTVLQRVDSSWPFPPAKTLVSRCPRSGDDVSPTRLVRLRRRVKYWSQRIAAEELCGGKVESSPFAQTGTYPLDGCEVSGESEVCFTALACRMCAAQVMRVSFHATDVQLEEEHVLATSY